MKRRLVTATFARRAVVLLSFVPTIACLVPVVSVRGLIPPMWAIPMDIAPKFGSAIAAIVAPITFDFIVDQTGDWHLPFRGSVGINEIAGAATPAPVH